LLAEWQSVTLKSKVNHWVDWTLQNSPLNSQFVSPPASESVGLQQGYEKPVFEEKLWHF